jgi:heptosyltransferase II
LQSPAKILVIGPSWVGDMVLAQSLFKALKLQHPDCIIDVAAPAWTLPLVDRMPEVNRGIALPFKHGKLDLFKRIQFGKALRVEQYTQAILLTNSLKSAILPFFANIPKRTGFVGEMRYGLLNDIRTLDKAALPRTVDRFVHLSRPKEVLSVADIQNPALIANHANALIALENLKLKVPTAKVLGLCPGAEFGEAKRWPVEYYAEVARNALEKGWQVWLFGSEKDIPVTEKINALSQQQCVDFGGKTQLGEAIDLMSLCDMVVSNDSGLMHVAAALNKKVIAIYGSSNPHHTPPMSAKAVIEYLGIPCSPCFKRECPLAEADLHLKCLKDIKPQTILQYIHPITAIQ